MPYEGTLCSVLSLVSFGFLFVAFTLLLVTLLSTAHCTRFALRTEHYLMRNIGLSTCR